MRGCLWMPWRHTLTAAATLAVGLPPRQQHLQAVPEHDCGRRPGRDDTEICWRGESVSVSDRLSAIRLIKPTQILSQARSRKKLSKEADVQNAAEE